MKTYKYTIIYYKFGEGWKERKTNSMSVVEQALKDHRLVVDNSTGLEYLPEL